MSAKPEMPSQAELDAALDALGGCSAAELNAAFAEAASGITFVDTATGAPVAEAELVAALGAAPWALADETTFAADGSYAPQFDDEIGLGSVYAADGSLLPEYRGAEVE